MVKSKLGFDIDIKFKDKEEAMRYAKKIIEKIRQTCKKKNWSATAMVCISNTKGNTAFLYYEHSGKIGRPRKAKDKFLYKGNVEVERHLHIIMASKPSYAL